MQLDQCGHRIRFLHQRQLVPSELSQINGLLFWCWQTDYSSPGIKNAQSSQYIGNPNYSSNLKENTKMI
jgi:hypothetical protein